MRRTTVVTVLLGCVLAGTRAEGSALQLKLQAPAFDRLMRAAKNQDIDIARPLVSAGGMACFDDVGMTDMTVKSKLIGLTIAPNEALGQIDVSAEFDRVEIRGQLYANAGFPCPDVDEPIDPLVLEHLTVSAGVKITATADGRLELAVAGEVVVTVDSTSLSGPSDFVIGLIDDYDVIESMLLPQAGSMAVREMLAQLGDRIESVRSGEFMAIGYRIAFRQPVVESDGVALIADTTFALGETKAACLPEGTAKPAISSNVVPGLPMAVAPASGLVVASPSALIEDALAAAWWAGDLCGDMEIAPPTAVGQLVARVTGGDAGPFRLRYGIGQAPKITISGNDIVLSLHDAWVNVVGPQGTVVSATADLVLTGSVRTETETRLLRATLGHARVNLHAFDSVLHTSDEAIRELEQFFEIDVPNDFVTSIQDLAIADAMLVDPMGRMVVDLLATGDGVSSALSFFGASDPEVDLVAPDTQVATPRASGMRDVLVKVGGTDDRTAPLTYSWQIDGYGWSAWTNDSEIRLAPPVGEHVFEVRARDPWGNVDPTPASATFTVDDERTLSSCACSTTAPSTPGTGLVAMAAIAIAALVARRRRAAALVPVALFVAIAPAAHAQDTSVLPEGRFKASASVITWLQNPQSSTTGGHVEIPAGLILVGIDAKTKEQHQVRADVVLPSLNYGITPSFTAGIYVPLFLNAETNVRKFEARSLGVDVTPEAQLALRDAGYRDPKGSGDQPVSDWRGRGIGDVIVGGRWRAIRTRTHAAAVTFGADLPTGRRDDPRVLTDFGFGDGQLDVFADGAFERKTGPAVLGAIAGYRLRLPGETSSKPLGSPTLNFVVDPGDVIRGGVAARTALSRFPLSASWTVEHHLADHMPSAASLPDRSGTVHVIQASAGISGVRSFLKQRTGLPAALSMGVSRSMSSNVELQSWQAELRFDLFM